MSTFCNELSENSVTARPVQIVSPYNHSFHLELQQLKNVLEHNELKDRYVVVVSIAGAFRKGKSFLLNFFLKYLEAQVILVQFNFSIKFLLNFVYQNKINF